VVLKVGRSEGDVFLDAFWGGHAKLYSFIPDLSGSPVVSAACGVCQADLMVPAECTENKCNSRQEVLFHLPGGKNKIYICANLGCPGHRVEIADLTEIEAREISRINYFGMQIDDFLMDI
jgi:hypothetical protein